MKLGSPASYFREAVIDKDNHDGTVDIKLSEGDGQYVKNVPYPSTWQGPQGQFMGGAPVKGSMVIITQGAGGQYYIASHIKSDEPHRNYISNTESRMRALRDGRALIQVADGNKLIVDPKSGILAGDDKSYIQIDPNKEIISHNFSEELRFTEGSREVNGIIKRDLQQNSTRNIFDTLNSHHYDKSLFKVSMDPSYSPSVITAGNVVRNPPLVEKRELIYEFADSFNFSDDTEEESKFAGEITTKTEKKVRVSRRKLRTDALSLDIGYPNHLIENIKGTAVDAFGNIIDINRAVLPIGQIDELSLKQTGGTAFAKIREQLRKSIAYHFEINTRKVVEDLIPPDDKVTNYGRRRSKFFIDIDKEGQFKMNIPASSETGNVPLLTRYENFSTLYARDNDDIDPNSYIRSDNNKEIYLESFANKAYISLDGKDDVLSGFEAPKDRITGDPITYGTAHHNIIETCKFLTTASPRLPDTKQVHPYIHDTNRLNDTIHFNPYNPIVSDSIVVTGENANAGGRSGCINLDGFISVNVGANTVDRQSLWIDYAGGVVANVGRDKQGISYALGMDGDFLMQVGGTGIGNTADSRFDDQYDALRDGTIDIRVIVNNGQQIIFRMAKEGIDIFSPGAINITSQQGINIKCNGTLNLEGTMIQQHAGSTKKVTQKFPAISS